MDVVLGGGKHGRPVLEYVRDVRCRRARIWEDPLDVLEERAPAHRRLADVAHPMVHERVGAARDVLARVLQLGLELSAEDVQAGELVQDGRRSGPR
jgi:hypothetical protein